MWNFAVLNVTFYVWLNVYPFSHVLLRQLSKKKVLSCCSDWFHWFRFVQIFGWIMKRNRLSKEDLSTCCLLVAHSISKLCSDSTSRGKFNEVSKTYVVLLIIVCKFSHFFLNISTSINHLIFENLWLLCQKTLWNWLLIYWIISNKLLVFFPIYYKAK